MNFNKPIIVLGHGCFDLLHMGHIQYLQEARCMGDILLVTVTSDEWVRKGDGRPFFTAEQRCEAIAALDCVDWVGINYGPDASDAIRKIRPDIFVKGPECRYQTNVGLEAERRAIEEVGGEMAYTNGQIFS